MFSLQDNIFRSMFFFHIYCLYSHNLQTRDHIVRQGIDNNSYGLHLENGATTLERKQKYAFHSP